MAWELFNPAYRPPGNKIPPDVISILKSGALYINFSIHDQLGDHVELDYNAVDNLLRLRPVPKQTQISYRTRKASKQNSWTISLIAFIAHYGLEYIKSKRYKAVQEDDIFVIDLNNPINEVRKR